MTGLRHIGIGLLLATLLASCAPTPRTDTLTGQTMGTTYSIRIARSHLSAGDLQALQESIDSVLEEVNRQMSTYRPDSEISRFNQTAARTPVAVSANFAHVVRRALELAEATGGAFDPTVGALVNLWGFGPDGTISRRPAPEQVEAVRGTVGHRHLSLETGDRLSKAIDGLKLDLGAIAKGFGVDQVAALLRKNNLQNFIVEIGGETMAEGVNAQGEPWRVGVLRPDFTGSELQGVARLTGGRAIATSGNYRNFFRDENAVLQAHIIDPRTAAPAQRAVASVSVWAADCLTADGLATALVVLGPEEGLSLLQTRFPGVEALFILSRPGNQFEELSTPGFAAALQYRH